MGMRRILIACATGPPLCCVLAELVATDNSVGGLGGRKMYEGCI